jgi:hypothetical protein
VTAVGCVLGWAMGWLMDATEAQLLRWSGGQWGGKVHLDMDRHRRVPMIGGNWRQGRPCASDLDNVGAWLAWTVVGALKMGRPPPSIGGGLPGRSDVHAARRSLGVADPGENPRFWPLPEPSDGDVLRVLEGLVEVKLPVLSTTLRRNPKSLDKMMAMTLRRSLLRGINFGVAHR